MFLCGEFHDFSHHFFQEKVAHIINDYAANAKHLSNGWWLKLMEAYGVIEMTKKSLSTLRVSSFKVNWHKLHDLSSPTGSEAFW